MSLRTSRDTAALVLRTRFLGACLGPRARNTGATSRPHLVNQHGYDAALRSISEAFKEAAESGDKASLMDALAARRDGIDPYSTRYALQCLVGLACRQSGATPRDILESEFRQAPSDDFWCARLTESA